MLNNTAQPAPSAVSCSVKENAASPWAPVVPLTYVPCFTFSILKLAWNLTCVIGHNALTQGAHCIQHEGTPCIPYLKREWMTELKEVTTCIPVPSWLRPFPASTEKTQIWQSDKIILLYHTRITGNQTGFFNSCLQSHSRRRKQSNYRNSYTLSEKEEKFMVTNVTKASNDESRKNTEILVVVDLK